ncbi:MAG: S24 family peptidase [Rhizobiales bacterium]|nr:S24 family peptidase [Hyphomicrobiales bacterium]NRB13638.1 S24 family peptidase [Hyphomicrobiales bacterium]
MFRLDKILNSSSISASNLRLPSRFAKLDLDQLGAHFSPNPIIQPAVETLDMPDEAMQPTIPKGATLVVEYGLEPAHNDIVIARYYGDVICRRIFISKMNSWLYTDDKELAFIKLKDCKEVTILGVVTSHYIEHAAVNRA